MNINSDELIKKALGEPDDNNYKIRVKVDTNDADYLEEIYELSEEEFKRRGLAQVLLASRMIKKNIRLDDEYEASWVLHDILPGTSEEKAHTIVELEVTKGNQKFDPFKIDDKTAMEILKNYIYDENYDYEPDVPIKSILVEDKYMFLLFNVFGNLTDNITRDVDYDECISKGLERKIEKQKWKIAVKGDVNDADYKGKVVTLNNEEFKSSGFPIAVIISLLLGHNMQGYEWISNFETLVEDYMPHDGWGSIHTYTDLKVTYGSKTLDLSKLTLDEKKEIIRNYLKSEEFEYYEFTDDEIEELLNDIFKVVEVKDDYDDEDEEEIDEIEEEEKPDIYRISIEGYEGDNTYLGRTYEFDDIEFAKEGLPLALIAYYSLKENYENKEAIMAILRKILPVKEGNYIHTITNFKVYRNNKYFNIGELDIVTAKNIVYEYLFNDCPLRELGILNPEAMDIMMGLFPSIYKMNNVLEKEVKHEPRYNNEVENSVLASLRFSNWQKENITDFYDESYSRRR